MSIFKIAHFSVLALCMVAGSAIAEVKCPSGLVYIGQAYQENSRVNAEAKVPAVPVLVKFPKHFSIDTSYRQTGGQWAGGSADAVMTDADVPNGLYIIASGASGGSKGWSVHKPELRVLEENNNTIVQRGYEMKLYCHTGSGVTDMIGQVSCNVKADLCAKPIKE